MKMNFPFLECHMCGRANDNPCEECLEHVQEQQCSPKSEEQKIYIGSGEDCCLEMLNANT